MITGFLKDISYLNEGLFKNFDYFVNSLPYTDWLKDAILDSVHTLPILLILFFIIECFEFFYTDKIKNLVKNLEKSATLVGSFIAVIPQCGFSIIAGSLYLKQYITKGTLIAIYLATSDEAIPILLSKPDKIHYVIPIILIKLCIAVISGYSIDYILKDNKYMYSKVDNSQNIGCCKHLIEEKNIKDLLIHPVKHTLNVFIFILIITILLNYLINLCSNTPQIITMLSPVKILTPIITAVIGLIPNCAISVGLTMMLINGTLPLSAVISGLLSNAGLGILILFKENKNIKDNTQIISILLIISIISGYLLQFLGL